MEKSTEESPTIESTGGEDRRSTRVRRRLVQATLFPHKSPDLATEEKDCEKEDDEDDEEEDYCGSQTKKKRKPKPKPKPKTKSQSRASKKVAVNGIETENKKMDGEDSPIIVKADFFLKVSEKRHQTRQPKDQLCIGSPEATDKICSPPDSEAKETKSPRKVKRRANATPEKRRTSATPEKRRKSMTPKKIVINNSSNEACSSQMPANPVEIEIPNLRLEAKMTAEENSRIFSGRQIHPFFSFCKAGKRNQETTDVESKWCSIERKDKSIAFSPIHVFEKVQDDGDFSLDWGNWVFSESCFVSTSGGLETVCPPIYEGSIKSLQFDNFLNVSHPDWTFLSHSKGSSDQCPIQLEEVLLDHSSSQREVLPDISPALLADDQLAQYQEDHEMENVGSFSKHAHESDVEWQGISLKQMMMSYYRGCGSQPENSMWTNKYQPEKAMEICGNRESVDIINEWLRVWHEKGFRAHKKSINGDKWFGQDVDYSSCPSDSDSDDVGEETGLKSVLLVTGSVGSGKSAAIYACAKEQGFQVIEVNASDWRNGALVKQKFGEAVESHWLQCAMENSDNKHLLETSPATRNTAAAKGSDNANIELIPLSDEEDSQVATGMPRKSVCNENRTATDQSNIKTLILFEDVDATLYEDRGFITTIQQLAETAKRPMILTSNSNNPVLPNNLDRVEVCFTMPSSEELLRLVYMICAEEKAEIQPCLVERFITCCQGDIRKTIMHLQFWCQAQRYRGGSQVRRTYDPIIFDVEAGHQILPKIIPFGCPSQLSEVVEKEISKSLLMVNENPILPEIAEEEELDNNNWKAHSSEPDSIEAKKEAMLSMHHSDQDDNEFAAQFDTTRELSNSSGSPIAFTRRNLRSKPDALVSSDSEEDCLAGGFLIVPDKQFHDMNSKLLLEVNNKSPSHSEEKLEKSCCHLSETEDYSHINGTCKSVDVSCVPESSFFVPETEISNGTVLYSATVSCGHVDDRVEADFTSNSLTPNILPIGGDDHNKCSTGLHQIPEILGNTCDVNSESIHKEGVGDSHIERVDAVPREYQVMDECSRMDFNGRSKSMEKPRSLVVIDFVQETWRKLRNCHMDLQQLVTPEQKDAFKVLKLGYGLSNLISEADLLFRDCQPLIFDYLEPSMVPCEKSHSLSWDDDHSHMTSALAQHGMCLYAKEIAAAGSNTGSASRVDLAQEMLVSSTNTMALGKLVSQDTRTIQISEKGLIQSGTSLNRELESSLCNIVQSIVPLKSCLALKGDAFHEYLSSLGSISRSEASRLSESNGKLKQRRARVARNYLSTGALSLSPEDISLLARYNSCRQVSSKSTDECLR